MNLNKKRIIIFIIIFLIIISFFIFNIFTIENEVNNDEKKEEVTEEKPQAEEEFADINLNLYNKDKTVKLELSAKNLSRYEDENLLKMNPVEIRAYDIEKTEESSKDNLLYVLRGEKGNYQSDKGLLTISGVVTIERNKKRFSFEKITIDEDKNEVLASGDVVLESEEIIVRSDKFKSNLALDYFEFYGDKKVARLNWKEIDDIEK
mgnify:CR=1 FL=1